MVARPPHAPPSSPLLVGNDVVDLGHPRCREMPLDGRFAERVLTSEEHSGIRAAPAPRRALWLTWAAKEAAYKVVSKRRGSPPPFVHASFVVLGPPLVDRIGLGEVVWEGLRIPFRDDAPGSADLVHVVAWSADGPPRLDAGVEALPGEAPPLGRLTDRERAAVHSPASGWVRLLARERAASLLGRAEPDVQIVCGDGPPGRTVPELLLDGEPCAWDVSLSHHGRWVAWALGTSDGAPGSAGPPESPTDGS